MSNIIPFSYQEKDLIEWKESNLGFVYAAEDELGRIKIGSSLCPQKRIRNISSGAGVFIEKTHLSGKCANYKEAELEIHKQFHNNRINGEWFSGVDFIDVATAIDSICTFIPSDDEIKAMVINAKARLNAITSDVYFAFKNKKKPSKDKEIEHTPSILEEFVAAKDIAITAGIKGHRATLCANKAVERIAGINVLEVIGVAHLIRNEQEAIVSLDGLSTLVGFTKRKVLRLLCECGVIESYRDDKNKLKWKPTTKGKQYTVLKDTGKKSGTGTPVQQLFFLDSVREVM